MRNIVYLILSVWIAIFDFRTQIQTKANHIYLEREKHCTHTLTHIGIIVCIILMAQLKKHVSKHGNL